MENEVENSKRYYVIMLLRSGAGTKPETANQRAYKLEIGKPTGSEL